MKNSLVKHGGKTNKRIDRLARQQERDMKRQRESFLEKAGQERKEARKL